jgi:thiamine kinase-like enzyme
MAADPWTGIEDRDRMSVLASVKGAVAVAPLPGGITNRNYRVDTPAGTVVVRVSDVHSADLAIDRENEYLNSQAAAAAGVGAPVIEYRQGEGLLVVGWIEGRTWGPEDLAVVDNHPRVAAACRALHAGPRFAGDFDMLAIQARYLAIVEQRGYRLPPGYHDHAGKVARMAAAFSARPEPTVPCNNDLLAANFIDDGDRVWLIDYEYSGNNEPSFELGNIWSEASLGADLLDPLVAAYWGADRPDKVARARLWGLMSKYGWTLWASIQEATSPIAFDYWSWGMEKYERAEAEFASREFDVLLDLVGGS